MGIYDGIARAFSRRWRVATDVLYVYITRYTMQYRIIHNIHTHCTAVVVRSEKAFAPPSASFRKNDPRERERERSMTAWKNSHTRLLLLLIHTVACVKLIQRSQMQLREPLARLPMPNAASDESGECHFCPRTLHVYLFFFFFFLV